MTRVSLVDRNPVDVARTVLRVVGANGKIHALDVAAFQSFADDDRPAARPVATLAPRFEE